MRVKGDEHYVNMKREKSKEREKEKYFLRCARSLLSSSLGLPGMLAHRADSMIVPAG